MMKKTLKYFSLFVLGFLFIFSCQQDDFQNHSVHNHEDDIKFKRKKISLEDIENKEVIEKKIETFFNIASSSKYKTTLIINQQNYFLETNEIMYIEDEATHSYTIPMLSLDNSSTLVNLLLSSENGFEYDMYIVEYGISEEEQLKLMTGEYVNLENKITFSKVDEINFQNKKVIGSSDGCSTITYVPGVCASGQHQYGDLRCEYLDPPQIDKMAPPFQNIIISYIYGCEGGGGSSSGNSSTNPTNPTNPGTGGGNKPIKNPSNTTPSVMSQYSKFFNFHLLGKRDIQDWLQATQNTEYKQQIENYLNNTGFILGAGTVEEQNKEKYEFAEEASIALMKGGKVDFFRKIIYLIDKPCQNQILQDIISTNSPFTNLISDIFGNSNVADIRFTNDDLLNENAAAVTSPQFYGTSENYIISIKFDNDYLDNATNLSIAATTLHELVHAHLMYLFLNDQLIAQNSSYQSLMDAFLNFYKDRNEMTFNELDNEMHNAMSDYIQKMANSLYNYAQNNNISNISVDDCVALAWSTMQGYDLFDEVLTSQQQQNYSQIGYDEQNNTGNKKGIRCP